MSSGFEMDPRTATEHAGHVESAQALLGGALDAAENRLGSDDFGSLGHLLAGRCDETMAEILGALRSAVDTGRGHATAVRAWAEAGHVDENTVLPLGGTDI